MTDLSDAEVTALTHLEVTHEQEVFGGSFAESVETWRAGPDDKVLGFAFYLHGAPVGMTLFKRPPLSPDWVAADAASLHGLKIALPWQGQGLGHAAFRLSVDAARRHWPGLRRLTLAVDAPNRPALAVYRRYGMTQMGSECAGRQGPEYRLNLSFPP